MQSYSNGGIDPDAIINEPRRKRLRLSNLDEEVPEVPEPAAVQKARNVRAAMRSGSVESANSESNQYNKS